MSSVEFQIECCNHHCCRMFEADVNHHQELPFPVFRLLAEEKCCVGTGRSAPWRIRTATPVWGISRPSRIPAHGCPEV